MTEPEYIAVPKEVFGRLRIYLPENGCYCRSARVTPCLVCALAACEPVAAKHLPATVTGVRYAAARKILEAKPCETP